MNPKGIPDNFIEVSPGNWAHPSRVTTLSKIIQRGNEVAARPPKHAHRITKPLLNHTEQRCFDLLESEGVTGIMKQAITLRLDPPFKRYTPDLAYFFGGILRFIEVKGLHRFRRAGIAKAALAAKTYPQFLFRLYEWDGDQWKLTTL